MIGIIEFQKFDVAQFITNFDKKNPLCERDNCILLRGYATALYENSLITYDDYDHILEVTK